MAEYDLFGAKNVFRKVISKCVQNIVNEGKWFSCCTRADDRQVDVMKVKNSSGDTLGSMLRKSYPDMTYRSAVYRYMITKYMCYYEVPTVARDEWGAKNSFNKMLITSNIGVISEWLNIPYSVAFDKYYGRCSDNTVEDEHATYVKLYTGKNGERKVTVPRTDLDLSLSGTRIIPMFALNVGVDVLYKMAIEGCVSISYIKDGGLRRTITTTLNKDIVEKIYGKEISDRCSLEMYDGDFKENKFLSRGHIAIPDIEDSRYDNSIIRRLNIARIVEIKTGAKPNLFFVDKNIYSAPERFMEGVRKNYSELKSIVNMLGTFEMGTGIKEGIKDVDSLEFWVENQKSIVGTVFLQQLVMFMLGCPQWFPDYTGKESLSSFISSSDDVGFA